MRHAKSDWSTGQDDFDRPLSQRGHRDAPRMAEWLVANDLAPDAIITSAANRAATTAQYVADHVGLGDQDIDVRDGLYLASAQTWLDMLWGHDGGGRLLICGHNPGLDMLVDHLSGGDVELTADGKLMTTAAIAQFAIDGWADLGPDAATLVQLVRPKEL